ncbi:uncharacterized protein [Ptychodera flava]|uniref:uncharacterized protein n=1 Tax=Ptychodera flava TaxID=63121 RepID=UPI00396A96F5
MKIIRSRKNAALMTSCIIFGFILGKWSENITNSPVVRQQIDINSNQLCACQCNGNEMKEQDLQAKPEGFVAKNDNGVNKGNDVILGKRFRKPRKFFIDCGGNVASSVVLFKETYPDAADFYIHSFELDDRLCPYFAPFKNHTLHCPVAVSNVTGEITAYAEAAWFPGKSVGGEDKQWGGGSIFVSKNESVRKDGGERMLSYRKKVPAVDLSSWLREHVTQEDYLILKLDVEGAEYGILRKMLTEGTIQLVDKLYGEYHSDQPTGADDKEKSQIKADLKVKKQSMLRWIGERKTYHDFEFLHPTKVLESRYAPNAANVVISKCGMTSRDRNQVAIVIEVGMNKKPAIWLIETIRAYKKKFPCTIFVYGDFATQYPQLVRDWSIDFDIGVRGSSPQLEHIWENLNYYYTRMSIIGGAMRLSEIGMEPVFILPQRQSNHTVRIAQKHGYWVVDPNASFPPRKGTQFTEENYFKYRDVERVPRALRSISDALLRDQGGIISLDADLFDSYMISVFLLDYLFENSQFQLVGLKDCYD